MNSTPAAQVTGQTVYGYDGSVRWRIDALYDEDELLRKIRLYETSNPQVINIAFSYEAHSNKLLAVTPSLKTGAYEGYLEPHYYEYDAGGLLRRQTIHKMVNHYLETDTGASYFERRQVQISTTYSYDELARLHSVTRVDERNHSATLTYCYAPEECRRYEYRSPHTLPQLDNNEFVQYDQQGRISTVQNAYVFSKNDLR